ncbi:putative glycosyltransferase [Gordonia otitidis NBRC 100426]|uniref:Glycosyltransferase n=1 Tax=Gordonia otitidis (strain DSM 44809 / CCUG 52243 / JCM 12355 / NBRC 100426 / IFM 10032) TaxID=1108044 RepID=H5TRG5_GORO1|nr:glycosyltransferase family 39 protein [Gordonia otitidis]GAB36073.1 putative glycosyltransferase [Gordonia otitidis NBRC 100426]
MTTASRAADFGASPARQSIENVGISPDDIPLPRATTRERVAFVALLVGTAALYLWNITVNGNANTFYAGAAWAGSRNWEALLFGSVDPSNFITVDKPPVSQWIMGLSGQVFGYSSASMLVPEAVMGVASVALLYATVTRVSGRTAGLIAGAALALTPVAAMMFRFNNPDAAMVLLMTAAAYCTVRATSRASMRWLVLAGVALGFAFLAKMLEGLMVLPALGFVYLLAAPTSLGRRVCHLLAATLALVVSSGWYVLLTLLWPASSRPYLAGSTDNNFMNLVLGYNGLDRIAGHGGGHSPAPADMEQLARENPALTGGFGGGMFGSAPGITRLFGGEFGAEISFLLPSALVAFVVVLVLRGRTPRTDLVRAGALLFGLWLLVDGIVLSYMSGTVHPYYSLAIAPPVAGLVGIGVVEAWRARSSAIVWKMITARVGLAAMIVSGGIWAFALLDREPSWFPWLRWACSSSPFSPEFSPSCPSPRVDPSRQSPLDAVSSQSSRRPQRSRSTATPWRTRAAAHRCCQATWVRAARRSLIRRPIRRTTAPVVSSRAQIDNGVGSARRRIRLRLTGYWHRAPHGGLPPPVVRRRRLRSNSMRAFR